MSIMMLVYIFWLKPVRELISMVSIALYEILGLIANFCVLTLASLDSRGTLTPDLQTHLSHTILVVNTIINALAGINVWIDIAFEMWMAYRASKRHGLAGKTSWLNALVASYQNPGMDFDEYSNEHITSVADGCLSRSKVHSQSSLRRRAKRQGDIESSLKDEVRVLAEQGAISDSCRADNPMNEKTLEDSIASKSSRMFSNRNAGGIEASHMTIRYTNRNSRRLNSNTFLLSAERNLVLSDHDGTMREHSTSRPLTPVSLEQTAEKVENFSPSDIHSNLEQISPKDAKPTYFFNNLKMLYQTKKRAKLSSVFKVESNDSSPQSKIELLKIGSPIESNSSISPVNSDRINPDFVSSRYRNGHYERSETTKVTPQIRVTDKKRNTIASQVSRNLRRVDHGRLSSFSKMKE